MDNEEMSGELIYALNKYNEMVAIRQPIWENLVDLKYKKLETSTIKKNELIAALENNFENYE